MCIRDRVSTQSTGIQASTMGMMDGLMRTLGRGGKFARNQGKAGPVGPKRGNKNYYKGKGGINVGRHTRKGGYRLDSAKIPMILCPPPEVLRNTTLQPYVSHNPM
eukprot:TRINITY_DN1675_c0_g1_i1.p2 TRINITY_DN1675_c0_g1~~TRINITY_DN1675_c0_g1_i1.p2  ORF type:complete len:105 (-),score=22.78 TRINITY_DN1675_c0_g1_i1:295-609(-)